MSAGSDEFFEDIEDIEEIEEVEEEPVEEALASGGPVYVRGPGGKLVSE